MREFLEVPDKLKRLSDDVDEARAVAHAEFEQYRREGKTGLPRGYSMALKDLATATKSLASEMRAWAGHVKSSMDKMTDAQKARIFMQFIQGLPLSPRRDMYIVLARAENERPDGLGLYMEDKFDPDRKVEL